MADEGHSGTPAAPEDWRRSFDRLLELVRYKEERLQAEADRWQAEVALLRDELAQTRHSLAVLQANERAQREKEDERDFDLPQRSFIAAADEYRLAKERYTVDANEIVEPQRRFVTATIDMLRAMSKHERGMRMVALDWAVVMLSDAIAGGLWKSMERGHGNPDPHRRQHAIGWGLMLMAAARAGLIDVDDQIAKKKRRKGGYKQEIVLRAAAEIVAVKYGRAKYGDDTELESREKNLADTVMRWWREAEEAGRIEELTPTQRDLHSFQSLFDNPLMR